MKTFTVETLKQLLIGAGITALVTLGAALVSLGPTTDLQTWGGNLLLGEAAALGSYLINTLRSFNGAVTG